MGFPLFLRKNLLLRACCMLDSILLVCASLALASGVLVIRSKNPVHRVLFLVLTFCMVSALLISLGLDFFAMTFLVVYVGAIAILFLFVVMMLNIKFAEMYEHLTRFIPLATLVGIFLFFQLMSALEVDCPPLLALPTSLSAAEMNAFATEVSLRGFLHWVTGKISFAQWKADWVVFMEQSAALQALDTSVPHPVHHDWLQTLAPLSSLEAIGRVLYTQYVYLFLLSSMILLVGMIGAIMLTLHRGAEVKRQDVFAQNARDPLKTIYKVRSEAVSPIDLANG